MLLMGLEVEFTAEGLADLLAGIQSVGTESAAAAPEVDALSGAVGELKSVVLELVGAISLVEIGKKMFDEVSQTQLATNQLGIAFRNVGADAKDFGANIAAAIAPLRGQGQYTEWEINQALARLITLTGDAGGAMENIGLVANIAAFRHTDLASAALLVSRAMEGNFTMLQRYIPSLLNFNTQAEKMAELQRVMAGQAEAAADTIGGSLTKEMTALKELGEAIGEQIAGSDEWKGITETVVTALHDATDWVKRNGEEIRVSVGLVVDLVRSLRDLAVALVPGTSGSLGDVVELLGVFVGGTAQAIEFVKGLAGEIELMGGRIMEVAGVIRGDPFTVALGKQMADAGKAMNAEADAAIAQIQQKMQRLHDIIATGGTADTSPAGGSTKTPPPPPPNEAEFQRELKALEERQKLVAEGLAQDATRAATIPRAIALEKELNAMYEAQTGNLTHQIEVGKIRDQLLTTTHPAITIKSKEDAQKFDTQVDPTAQAMTQATALHALALEMIKDDRTLAEGKALLAQSEQQLYAIRASGLASGTQIALISKTLATDDGAAAKAKADYLASAKADAALAAEEIKTKSDLAARDKALALAELDLALARTDVTETQKTELTAMRDRLEAEGIPKFKSAGINLGQALHDGFTEAFKKGGNAGAGLDAFGASMLKQMGNIFAQMGASINVFGALMTLLQHSLGLSVLGSGLVAIAVGVGLEALASSLQADAAGSTAGGGSFSLPSSQGASTSTSYLTPSSSQPYAQGTTYPGQGLPPMVFNVIGPSDPRAQAAIMQAVRLAVKRGDIATGVGGR